MQHSTTYPKEELTGGINFGDKNIIRDLQKTDEDLLQRTSVLGTIIKTNEEEEKSDKKELTVQFNKDKKKRSTPCCIIS
jgi:hypothetical protein